MEKMETNNMFEKAPTVLSKGKYLEIVVKLTLQDDAIIRSNDAEEVLTYKYKDLGNRFIIPWRKIKGKLRRLVMEKQRGLGIEPNCYLKDDLCMTCPSCFIFGGTGETSNAKVSYNLLSRILGETFISLTETKGIEPYTQNAVSERDLKTGQALMSILTVPAETEFIGVITLRDPTAEMASIVIDNISRLTRLGARSVEWGKVKADILGYKFSDRETMYSIDLAKSNGEIKGLTKSLNDLPDVDSAYTTLNNAVKKELKEMDLNSKKPEKGKKNKDKEKEPEKTTESEEV